MNRAIAYGTRLLHGSLRAIKFHEPMRSASEGDGAPRLPYGGQSSGRPAPPLRLPASELRLTVDLLF